MPRKRVVGGTHTSLFLALSGRGSYARELALASYINYLGVCFGVANRATGFLERCWTGGMGWKGGG